MVYGLCHQLAMVSRFPSLFDSHLRLGQPILWELLTLLMATAPLLMMGLRPFRALGDSTLQAAAQDVVREG